MTPTTRHIVIIDKQHGLPYSKGLMASSLMLSGISAAHAFRLAERIETALIESEEFEVTSERLREMAEFHLREIDDRHADRYVKWQTVEDLDVPLIILIGGSTGVGKSTTATQLAARLGITRVISTDAVREVLRSAMSRELMPSLYESSFNADRALGIPLPKSADRLIIGFQRQVSAVAVGVKALIARALAEGTDIIVEGAHLVPGFLDGWEEEFKGAVLVPIVMTVEDEALHRAHFHMRALETRSTRHDHYVSSIERIRRIQDYVVELARERDVPVIESYDLDSTINEIVTIVLEKALTSAIEAADLEVSVPKSFSINEEGELVRRQRLNRLRSWETLRGRRKA